MKNVIGQPARGENFYHRPNEIKKIVTSLNNGNNIQITAPRRVGKTSILWYLQDNNIENNYYVYIDTESVNNIQLFFKKVLSEILKKEEIAKSDKLDKQFKGANKFFKKIKSVNVLGYGVEFNHESEAVDWYKELENFLLGFSLSDDKHLIILIDEFPQTVENIINVDKDAAISFLQHNRTLRLNPDINKKVRFICTGSIGLNQTVSKIDATAYINDLNSIEIAPLSKDEATNFFIELLHPNSIIAENAAIDTLLDIVQWYIPFHIQLIVQEIILITDQGGTVTSAIVNEAVKNIINLRNQNHFDHYYTRMKTQFKNGSFEFADAILKEIAQEGSINRVRLADLSTHFNVEKEYRKIIETLMHDGYIHNSMSPDNYSFISPILKLWWINFIC